MLLDQVAIGFLSKEADFVYKLYEAAELEVRSSERYVLIGLAGMYSYLATKDVPAQFKRWAWFAPTFIVLFAGIRALGLGWRQGQLIRYLRDTETSVLGASASVGWAHSFIAQKSMVAVSAGVFYLLLLVATIIIARRMTSET